MASVFVCKKPDRGSHKNVSLIKKTSVLSGSKHAWFLSDFFLFSLSAMSTVYNFLKKGHICGKDQTFNV